MKTALITGLTGQDGAYLAEFLLTKGYNIFGTYRRASTPNFWRLAALGVLNKIHLIPADMIDMCSLAEAIEIANPDEVYNLAAQSYVGASFDQPILTAEVDGIGTLRMLELLRNSKKNIKFYQASTSELYGESVEQTRVQQDENTPFLPNSPYAIAKLYSYHIVKVYREAYGLFACNGILFNHESPLRGLEFVTRKITNSVARIRLGMQRELKLGNIETKRDWGFAPDYVEAMWLMLQQDKPSDYVIATHEAHSVKDFVKEAFDLAGLNWENYVQLDSALMRPRDVAVLKGDYSKAKLELGWEPKVRFKELVKLMLDADIDRWKKFNRGELVHWDAACYPEGLDILSRKKEHDKRDIS